MVEPKSPKLLTIDEIAKRLGWTTRRAWRMLVRLGVIEVTPGSRRRHFIPAAILLKIRPGLSILEESDL